MIVNRINSTVLKIMKRVAVVVAWDDCKQWQNQREVHAPS